MRTIKDIPENRVACYEWKPVNLNGREGSLPREGDAVCVSVPFECAPEHRAIAQFFDGKFLLAGTQTVLSGVTFWCHAPVTPEDIDRELKFEKRRQEDKSPELSLA